MKVIGTDRQHRMTVLPNTLDDYYAGAAKRFSHITDLHIEYEETDAFGGVLSQSSAGVVMGDFSLLRAFLADHEGSLSVRLVSPQNAVKLRLFFPSYLYGFVEDTFARAIHHKIEGPGFAARECVGKNELRLREYDGLFRLISEDDEEAAIWMALMRLTYPSVLHEVHRTAYQEFLRGADERALCLLADTAEDETEFLAYLIDNALLSQKTIENVLPSLSESRHAPMVAMLLCYQNKDRRRGRLTLD